MLPPRDRLAALQATQSRAVTLLTLALRHQRLPHGVLIVGPPSAPVRDFGELLVAALICRAWQRPLAMAAADPTATAILGGCGDCVDCRALASGTHANLNVLTGNERGAINVAQVRAATAKLHLRPRDGGLNLLRIEGAQGLHPSAQNALLKTLEEPPGEGCIIMETMSVGLMLPTILSRVVRVVLTAPHKNASLQALAQSGIDSPYAELLAPQVGLNAARAQELMAEGFVQVEGTVRAALTFGASVQTTVGHATALASNPQHFDMALALLELLLRDALASLGGAPEQLMTQAGVANVLTQLPGERISAGIDQLMTLRRQRKLNINRAQALEGLFVTLNHRGVVS